MKTRTLKNQILASFAIVIVVLCVCTLGLGYYGIKRDISERLQKQVDQSLDGVSLFYDEEIRRIGVSLDIANLNEEMSVLGEKMHLHYFYRLSAEQALKHPSEIVRQSAHSGQAVSGTRIIESDELATMSQDVRQRATIVIQPTAMAMPTERKVLDVAMAKEYALPLNDATGAVSEVLCGGRVVNQDSEFVDRIRQLVFGDEEYHAKPVGTVTVFLGDVRVSTNVLDKNGQRAIGTRISEEVYRKVFEQGLRWRDRALVVGHWYKAAYKPIYNINNAIIGVLYVGILEAPFQDKAATVLLAFLAVIGLASILAFVLAYILAGSISRPLTELLCWTGRKSCPAAIWGT